MAKITEKREEAERIAKINVLDVNCK